MRIRLVDATCQAGIFGLQQEAFTLVEVAVSLSITLLISVAIIASQLYGLRMTQIAQTKVAARDKAGQILRLLTSEIYSARLLRIGQGSFDFFVETAANQPQRGNAIQIYPSTDSNLFIRYYWDPADTHLKRVTNDAASAWIVARAISNSVLFTAEDYAGNILTNDQRRWVVGVLLDFYKLEDPNLSVGPGNFYTSYQLRARIAPPAF